MSILLQLLLVSILFMMIYNLRHGVIMFTAYLFLVPTVKLELAGFLIQQNFIYTIIFILLIAKYGWKKIQIKPFSVLCIFYGILLLSIPLKQDLPMTIQVNYWRANVMNNLLLPFIIWNVAINDKWFVKDFQKMLIFIIVLICAYGIFLTTMSGKNPYLMMISEYSNWKYNIDYAIASGGRMYGRIASVFQSPMTFAMFLGCSLCYIFFILENTSKKIYYAIVLLLVYCSVICGVRSIFGGLAIPIIYYLVSRKNLKLLFVFTILYFIAYYLISINPVLSLYFESILNSNQKSIEVGGSNLEMRFEQLEGCLFEIRNNPLWGKGVDWHIWYIEEFQNHPIILGFESLLFMVLCDNGFSGILLWILLFFALYFQQHFFCKQPEDRRFLTSIMLFYLSYCTITGDYGYMRMFLIFYYFMMATAHGKDIKTKITQPNEQKHIN